MKGPPGQLFDVGGHCLHALITGPSTNKLPVVLEAGLTAMSSCWGWVQQELSAHTKVLSYDRAGLGWSDPSGHPKDALRIARDLHALLGAARFPKPFLFAGHSMGGIFGRAYHSLYPQDLAGLVLIDASHPEQIERSPDIKWALRRFFWFLKATPYLASCGLTKIVGDFGLSNQSHGLPEDHFHAAQKFYATPQHMRATVREAEEWFTSTNQVRHQKLGDLPLLILSAPEKSLPGWLDLQKEFLQLSTLSRQQIITGATHNSILTHREHALRVAGEIREML